MLKRRLEIPPEHVFPVDEWRIVESCYSERYFARAETAFSLSNGYVGIRGTFDEGRPSLSPGTFVNGFHETWPIVHAEEAYGLARTGQTIVNVPDAAVIRLYVDDEPLFLPTARLRSYERVLDMRAGTLSRELSWSTAAGRHVERPLVPDRVARAPPSRGDPLRGRGGSGGARRDRLAGAQPPGRPAR